MFFFLQKKVKAYIIIISNINMNKKVPIKMISFLVFDVSLNVFNFKMPMTI